MAQEGKWTALQKELSASLKWSALWRKQVDSTVGSQVAAWEFELRLCKGKLTVALEWLALWRRGVTAIGSLKERLDCTLD